MLQFCSDTPFRLSVCNADGKIGILEWNVLWGEIPFLEKIWFEPVHRHKGYGKQAMAYFEKMLSGKGYRCALVSTRKDEDGQHFFRKIGYRDCGALDMSGFTRQCAEEIFLFKTF